MLCAHTNRVIQDKKLTELSGIFSKYIQGASEDIQSGGEEIEAYSGGEQLHQVWHIVLGRAQLSLCLFRHVKFVPGRVNQHRTGKKTTWS